MAKPAADPERPLGKLDLESAVMDAEAAAAVHDIIEDALTGPHGGSWADLGIPPRAGLAVVLLTEDEKLGWLHASQQLRDAVGEVSRIFYAWTALPH